MANVKFWTGTSATFWAKPSKDANTVYFITDDQSIYKGDVLYGIGDPDVIASYLQDYTGNYDYSVHSLESTTTLAVYGTSTLTGKVTASGGIIGGTNTNIGVLANGTQGNGLSLFGDSPTGQVNYGMFMALTSSFGTHGTASGDWATYLKMTGATTRGWIFKNGSTSVASIGGDGTLTLEGGINQNLPYTTNEFYAGTNFYGSLWCGSDINCDGYVYAANTSSDRRLKKDIVEMESGLQVISRLRPVMHKWNDEAKKLNKYYNHDNSIGGLIAQDVQEVLPDIVTPNSKEILTVDYQKIVPYLIKAVQELTDQNNALKNRLDKLELLIK